MLAGSDSATWLPTTGTPDATETGAPAWVVMCHCGELGSQDSAAGRCGVVSPAKLVVTATIPAVNSSTTSPLIPIASPLPARPPAWINFDLPP